MENWGLITGRTSVFLWDSERSGLQGQKRVASGEFARLKSSALLVSNSFKFRFMEARLESD